jgi:hypothetical protein
MLVKSAGFFARFKISDINHLKVFAKFLIAHLRNPENLARRLRFLMKAAKTNHLNAVKICIDIFQLQILSMFPLSSACLANASERHLRRQKASPLSTQDWRPFNKSRKTLESLFFYKLHSVYED